MASFETSQHTLIRSMTYYHKFLLTLVTSVHFIVQEGGSPWPQCQPTSRVISSSKGGSAIIGSFGSPLICMQSERVFTDPLSSAVFHCRWWTSLIKPNNQPKKWVKHICLLPQLHQWCDFSTPLQIRPLDWVQAIGAQCYFGCLWVSRTSRGELQPFRSGSWMPGGCGEVHWMSLCRQHITSSLWAGLPTSK